MDFLKRLDKVLTKIGSAFEQVPKSLSQGADYVLNLLSKYTDSLVEILSVAVDTIYRFFRQMLVNLVKIGWNLVKLLVFFLAPFYTWSFGYEIIRITSVWYYKAIGFFLFGVGGIGLLLFVAGLFASSAHLPASLYEKTSQELDKTAPRQRRVALLFIDFLAVVVIAGCLLLDPHYRFQSWLLKVTQETMEILFPYFQTAFKFLSSYGKK